jgi:PTH1 family peptidyl-tRNA hydrolase
MIIMGLGNPGPKYECNRHNVGYHVVDFIMQEPPLRFRRRLFASYRYAVITGSSGKRPLILVRYNGYMNRSGEIVTGLLKKFHASPENLLVVVDNMDLQPGVCRLKKGGGDAGHNGLKSIISNLNDGRFSRLYVGVGRPARESTVVDHVLGNPEGTEAKKITEACLRAAISVKDLASKSFSRVAEELNRREH